MRHRILGTLVTVGALAALFLQPVPVAGQRDDGTAPESTSDRPIPRMPDGKPDLSGVWDKSRSRYPGDLGRARADTLGMAMLAEGVRTRPFTPFGRWRYNQRLHETNQHIWCWLPGVPRVHIEPYPMEILQRSDRVFMLYEFNHVFRVIPTDGRRHPENLAPTYMGYPVGHWEGDTLVIDVQGFTDNTWLDMRGNVHSSQMRVIERFTRIAYDELEYQFTIEDPIVYSRPWTSAKRSWPLAGRPDWPMMEYSCTAFNRTLLEAGGGFAPALFGARPDVLEEGGQEGGGPGGGDPR